MPSKERVIRKCYCLECHHAIVNPEAIVEDLKIGHIDFKCPGCSQPKTAMVLLPEDESIFKNGVLLLIKGGLSLQPPFSHAGHPILSA